MKLEKQLDKILEILYDEKNLIFKRVPTIDIAVFGKQKYGLDWTDSEVLFIIDILIDEGYVIKNKGDFSGNNIEMPTYSLTTKGIRLKQNGGFVRKQQIEWWTNFLVIAGSIVTVILGFTSGYDFYDNHFQSKPNVECSTNHHCCSNNSTDNNTYYDISKSVLKCDSITDSIQKPCIGTTKK